MIPIFSIVWFLCGFICMAILQHQVIANAIRHKWSIQLTIKDVESTHYNKLAFFFLGAFGLFLIVLLAYVYNKNERIGFCNPLESSESIKTKLLKKWRPSNIKCSLGFHDHNKRVSIFGVPLSAGKLPGIIGLHTTEYCEHCNHIKVFGSFDNILQTQENFNLIKLTALDPAIVGRIYELDVKGYSSRMIADELKISRTTVLKYLDT